MSGVKGGNLGAMFLLELGVVAAAAVWGFTMPGSVLVRVVTGLMAPTLFVLMWALFGAGANPRFPLAGRWRVALELIWFGGGALAWASATTVLVGVIFFALWAINAALRVRLQGSLIPGG
ncbi:YrdB family protein [Nocardia suismassiliense]|uniref:YrdB family protein n=1 Tax=Nocardia suismassiliense TaxID=2077092 RepID=UPI000D1FB841|nr:YrdB family protein [Nocardia suismassiliense]